MSQKSKILKALKKGRKLTPLDALSEFSCFSLAQRIAEIKEDLQGTCYKINTRMVKSSNGKRFAEYRLGRVKNA